MLGLVVPIEVIGTFTFHIAEFAGVETNRLVELEGVGTGNVNTSTRVRNGTSLTLDFRR
jgi:hypothetical protein